MRPLVLLLGGLALVGLLAACGGPAPGAPTPTAGPLEATRSAALRSTIDAPTGTPDAAATASAARQAGAEAARASMVAGVLATQTEAASPVLRELAPYDRDGQHWRTFLVRADLPAGDLVALARQLHEADGRSALGFVDDASQFPQFVQYELHFGQADEAAYPDPAAWEAAHYLGIVQKMATGPGGQWQFTSFITGASTALTP